MEDYIIEDNTLEAIVELKNEKVQFDASPVKIRQL